MKTKKIVFGLMIAAISTGFVSAKTHPSIPSKTAVDPLDSSHFYSKKGFKDGYDEGYKRGYKDALKYAEKELAKYKKRLDAMERGKYLSLKHKVTPPRLYQVRNPDGSIKVLVGGCRIEGQLSPSEILSLPKYDGSDLAVHSLLAERTPTGSSPYGDEHSEPSDSVFLPGIDPDKGSTPQIAGGDVRVTYKFFPDTEFYRSLFNAVGKMFSVESGNKIKVLFDSEKEAASFMVRHNLRPGRDAF